jgi:multiple sugar transport system ATP-binding protein
MAAIDIDQVTKSFGDVAVLKAINLNIASGEFVVLVGPSGCGKSTLLRIIAGLETLTSGAVRIGGALVNDLPPKDRDIAMVFQSYALYPHMNVRDNMSYSLRLKRTPREKIADLVRIAGAKLGLESLLERKPRHLSGGQRQRVAMGRAIVRSPKAFLFDEPLSNLDARLREQMRFEIRKLHRELGATSVYVTHDQIEAMTMADRVVAMNEGIVQQVGSPLELYDDPANLFVAGFIGSPAMNFLQVEAKARGALAELHLAGGCWMEIPQPAELDRDRPLVLGLRPERVELGLPREGGIGARVELIEPTGLGTVVHLEAGGQLLKLFTTGRPELKIGEIATISARSEDIRLFDPVTGVRIRHSSM